MMNNSWIVFCPAGPWQVRGIKEASKMGYKTITIDSSKHAAGFDYSDDSICIDTNDFEKVVNELIARNILIVNALSFCSDVGIELCAYIREKFSIGGYGIDVSKNLVNKYFQRFHWDKMGLQNNFKWNSFFDPIEALRFIKTIDSKKILKPVDSSGSKGVIVLNKKPYITLKEIESAFHYSNSKQIIIEDFIDGIEYTVEVFYVDSNPFILAITEKRKLRDSNFTIANELFTPIIDDSLKNQIKKVIDKAAKALGYVSGIAHIEIIIEESGKINLVEFSARGGGFGLNHFFVESVCGFDPTKLTLMDALKMKIEINSIKNRKAVIKYLPAKFGTIKTIESSYNKNIEGLKVEFFAKVGDKFHGSNSDGDRLGYVFCVSDSLSLSMNIVDNVYNSIKVEYI